MLHTLFDHVYVVNLKRSGDRRRNIKEELWKIGCEYELFEATDGNDIEFVSDEENRLMDGWTRGSAGLVDTTIRIIEDAKEKGYDNVLILEDDIVFKGVNTRLIEDMKNYQWDIIHLVSHDYRTPQLLTNIKKLKGAWSCQAYAVNSKVYDEYLLWLRLRNRPIDWITSNVFHPRGTCYAPLSNMILTKPNLSTIRGTFVDYNFR